MKIYIDLLRTETNSKQELENILYKYKDNLPNHVSNLDRNDRFAMKKLYT